MATRERKVGDATQPNLHSYLRGLSSPIPAGKIHPDDAVDKDAERIKDLPRGCSTGLLL